MKITRNGQDFELTPMELEQAYREKKREYRYADIQKKLDELISDEELTIDESEYPDGKLDEDTLDTILERYDGLTDWHISYWDCFWDTMEEAIKAVLVNEEE